MGYSITEINLLKDAKSAVALWKKNLSGYQNFSPDWILERYFWYYCKNPSNKDKIWFLNTDRGDNVGGIAISSRLFKVNDKELMFGLGGNFFVSRKHRTLGPSVMLLRMLCKYIGNGVDAVYVFPPKNAIASFKRAGFIEIGLKKRMVKVLKSSYWLKKIFRCKLLVALLSIFIDTFLMIKSKETWTRLPKKFNVIHIEKFDEKFDSLWVNVSKKYPIISIKTGKILNWHYKKSPYRSHKIIGIFNKENQTLLCYIIYYLPEGEEGHVKIVDCLFDPDQNVFGFLLSEFIKYLRKEKMRSISFEFFGSARIKKIFAKHGFLEKSGGTTIMIYCSEANKLLSELKNPENWFLTVGDDNGVL